MTQALFTFVLVDDNRKPRNVRDVIRDDIAEYVRNLL